MVNARVPAIGRRRFCDLVTTVVYDTPPTEAGGAVRRTKARRANASHPARPRSTSSSERGTLTDVEFCVQLLQLQHGERTSICARHDRRIACTQVC